ncbi:MAG: antitoxin [Acidobacteria bacterium]|nr:antitoxin [Acidobacteriota bacterium]
MRTTMAIDDDVLLAARALARRHGSSIGAVISELARKGLNAGPQDDAVADSDGFYGFRPLPRRGKPVTNELIDGLRD